MNGDCTTYREVWPVGVLRLDQLRRMTAGHKQASTAITALQTAANQQLQQQARQQVQRILLAGLGVGLAGRGAMGLASLLHRNMRPPVQSATRRPVPLPMLYEDEKQAQLGGALQSFTRGQQATSLSGIPWFMPAATAAGVGGLAGGWSLLDYLLDKRRKGDVDADLESAKQEYEQALAGGKQASSPLGVALDELCDTIEKQATAADTAGAVAGGYGTYALISALLAGTLAHQWGAKRQNRRLLERAQTLRRRERAAASPAPLVALPVPKPTPLPRSLRTSPGTAETVDKELV